MIGGMATARMTDSDVTNNFAAVLQKIREGIEVVVEQNHRPVALIRAPLPQAVCCLSASLWLKRAVQQRFLPKELRNAANHGSRQLGSSARFQYRDRSRTAAPR